LLALPCVLVLSAGWVSYIWGEESSAEPDILELTRSMIDLEARGQKRRAWHVGHRVIALAEETLGGEHPTLAIYLDHVGVLARDLGERGEAEQLLLRALMIQERALGFDHVASQRTIRHLTALYRLQGQSETMDDIRDRLRRYRAEHPPLSSPSP
jgi:hypothetical protein